MAFSDNEVATILSNLIDFYGDTLVDINNFSCTKSTALTQEIKEILKTRKYSDFTIINKDANFIESTVYDTYENLASGLSRASANLKQLSLINRAVEYNNKLFKTDQSVINCIRTSGTFDLTFTNSDQYVFYPNFATYSDASQVKISYENKHIIHFNKNCLYLYQFLLTSSDKNTYDQYAIIFYEIPEDIIKYCLHGVKESDITNNLYKIKDNFAELFNGDNCTTSIYNKTGKYNIANITSKLSDDYIIDNFNAILSNDDASNYNVCTSIDDYTVFGEKVYVGYNTSSTRNFYKVNTFENGWLSWKDRTLPVGEYLINRTVFKIDKLVDDSAKLSVVKGLIAKQLEEVCYDLFIWDTENENNWLQYVANDRDSIKPSIQDKTISPLPGNKEISINELYFSGIDNSFNYKISGTQITITNSNLGDITNSFIVPLHISSDYYLAVFKYPFTTIDGKDTLTILDYIELTDDQVKACINETTNGITSIEVNNIIKNRLEDTTFANKRGDWSNFDIYPYLQDNKIEYITSLPAQPNETNVDTDKIYVYYHSGATSTEDPKFVQGQYYFIKYNSNPTTGLKDCEYIQVPKETAYLAAGLDLDLKRVLNFVNNETVGIGDFKQVYGTLTKDGSKSKNYYNLQSIADSLYELGSRFYVGYSEPTVLRDGEGVAYGNQIWVIPNRETEKLIGQNHNTRNKLVKANSSYYYPIEGSTMSDIVGVGLTSGNKYLYTNSCCWYTDFSKFCNEGESVVITSKTQNGTTYTECQAITNDPATGSYYFYNGGKYYMKTDNLTYAAHLEDANGRLNSDAFIGGGFLTANDSYSYSLVFDSENKVVLSVSSGTTEEPIIICQEPVKAYTIKVKNSTNNKTYSNIEEVLSDNTIESGTKFNITKLEFSDKTISLRTTNTSGTTTASLFNKDITLDYSDYVGEEVMAVNIKTRTEEKIVIESIAKRLERNGLKDNETIMKYLNGIMVSSQTVQKYINNTGSGKFSPGDDTDNYPYDDYYIIQTYGTLKYTKDGKDKETNVEPLGLIYYDAANDNYYYINPTVSNIGSMFVPKETQS